MEEKNGRNCDVLVCDEVFFQCRDAGYRDVKFFIRITRRSASLIYHSFLLFSFFPFL